MTPGVHQVLAGAAPRDAITNHALIAQGVIRGMGLRSEVFVDSSHLSRELVDQVIPHERWDDLTTDADRVIVHYSIDSTAFDHVIARAARTGLHYHNITPPDLLWRDAPHIAWSCLRGRRQLAELAGRIDLSAADSQFNAAEIDDLGFPPAAVIGILRTPVAAIARSPRRGPRARLLFVGRGAPNKCQHDAVLAMGALRDRGVDAELRLVGSWGSNAAYLYRCLRLAEECGVRDRVHVLGSLSDEDMASEFAHADLFLCLSEHEGFGVPLVQAMEYGLPVVAFAAGAVPETLGDAGLLLHDKRPSMVAEATAEVLGGTLAARMANGRANQLTQHSHHSTAQRVRRFVTDLTAC